MPGLLPASPAHVSESRGLPRPRCHSVSVCNVVAALPDPSKILILDTAEVLQHIGRQHLRKVDEYDRQACALPRGRAR